MRFGKGLRVVMFMLFAGFAVLRSSAQSSAGVKFGMSTPDIDPQSITVIDKGVNYYHIEVAKANYGFHNDTTPRYDEAAAKLVWSWTIAFFKKALG